MPAAGVAAEVLMDEERGVVTAAPAITAADLINSRLFILDSSMKFDVFTLLILRNAHRNKEFGKDSELLNINILN